AETLERLAPILTTARVLPSIHFAVGEWQADRAAVLARIAAEAWSRRATIVRSSADGEGSDSVSPGRHFPSILDVEPRDIAVAIERVIGSYGGQGGHHRVLVQPMLRDVAASGVAFTVDPNTGSPYLVVNYERGGDTSAATGGKQAALETFYQWREGPAPA